MATAALPPSNTSYSAAAVLVIKNYCLLVFHEERFLLPVPTLFWDMMCRYVFMPPLKYWGNEGLSWNVKGILTHWGRDKIDAILQTTFSSAFSWMKTFEFRLKFQWSLFLGVKLSIFQHWCRWWLGAVQATSHYLNQWWLVYWRIYASLGLNELTHRGWLMHICINKLTIIGSDNGLLPGLPRGIIWKMPGYF